MSGYDISAQCEFRFLVESILQQAAIQCCAERVSWGAAKQTALLLYFLWFSWILRSRDQKKSADKELQAAESVSERIAAKCGSRYGARSRISPGIWSWSRNGGSYWRARITRFSLFLFPFFGGGCAAGDLLNTFHYWILLKSIFISVWLP